MRNKIQRKIYIIQIFLLLFSAFPKPAFTQIPATPSAQQNVSTLSAALSTDSAFNKLSIGHTPQPSARIRRKAYVAALIKNTFQSKEKVEVIVKNVRNPEKYIAEIENERGQNVNASINKKYVNGEVIFSLDPQIGIQPGHYTVKVINTATEEVVSENKFAWGVLVTNTNKSIYLPGEVADIAMAVLDEYGRMVCDADVDLKIEAPNGITTLLSTADSTIIINPECYLHEVTTNPDYEAVYATSTPGRYLLKLTAVTDNGQYIVRDRFEVRDSVPFDIERTTATRIYPPENYPVEIKIKANQDFRGKIVETVPYDFQISPPSNEGIYSYSEESVLAESFDPKATYGIPDLPLPYEGEYSVTLGFGQQIEGHGMEDRYKKYGIDGHDGIDFALPVGTPVLAVDGGKVILAQENWVYGHTVVIQHPWGRTYYGHLSKIEVASGSLIQKGMQIGLSGATGIGITGPHLHFSVKPNVFDLNNLYYGKIDPTPFFGLASENPALSIADYPQSAKAVIWNVDIKEGQNFTIGYQYKTPNKSPYLYTIGPLRFISSDIKFPEKTGKFDVQINPFVLGTASPSSELLPSITSAEKVQTSSVQEEVVFSEIRPWQIAIDDITTQTFEFGSDVQGWTYTDDHANCAGVFTSGAGNPSGSLQTTGSKAGGGGHSCNTYWEWSGTWEDLGITPGYTVSGVSGSYDYAVSDDSTAGSWGTGAFELRDSGGTLRETMVAVLGSQTGTIGFTNRFGSEQSFTEEASNTSVRLRINTTIAMGGGTRTFAGQVDNLSVTITYTPTGGDGPTMEQMMRHGAWLQYGVENEFTF